MYVAPVVFGDGRLTEKIECIVARNFKMIERKWIKVHGEKKKTTPKNDSSRLSETLNFMVNNYVRKNGIRIFRWRRHT